MAEGAITWGAASNTCQVGISFESLTAPTAGQTTISVTAYVYWRAGVNMYDNTNSATWSGFTSGSAGSTSLNGPGTTRIRTITASVALQSGTSTATLTYNQAAVEYSGARSATASTTIPAKVLGVPDAPVMGAITRVSDTRHDVAWTNTNPTDANKPYQSILFQRSSDSGSTWTTVATLGSTATSYSDTTTTVNQKYRYRTVSQNTGGQGRATSTGDIYTTPKAPTSASAARSGSDIVVSWTNTATYRSGYRILASQAGGAYTVLATVGSAVATSYTHSAPAASTWSYQVQSYQVSQSNNLYSASSPATNTVQLLAPPNAPSLLSPDGSVVAAGENLAVTWQHNPTDASPQTQYQLRYRTSTDGGATWSAYTTPAIVTSATSSGVIPSASVTSGLLQWQVCTKGNHATFSPWSASAQLTVSGRPSVTITAPGSSVTSSSITASWTTFDPEGDAQTSAVVTLLDAAGSVTLWSKTVTTSTSVTVSGLNNSTSYVLRVRALAGGLWSTDASQSFSVTFARPPQPTLTVVWQGDTGSALITITNPAGTPAAVSNNIYADGVLVASDVGVSGTWVDPTPSLSGVVYTAEAMSSLPSSRMSDPVTLAVPSGAGIHFNGGGDTWPLHCALVQAGASLTDTPGIDVVLQQFAGDARPTPTWGPLQTFERTISGLTWHNTIAQAREDWDDLVRYPGLVCVRTARDTRYGVLSSFSLSHRGPEWSTVSITFIETETA